MNRGVLQFMKSLTYHEESSVCVQICRVLSALTCQKNMVGEYTRETIRNEWLPILHQWSEQSDTKLHFVAEKVLYNSREKNEEEHYLDEPIFLLYDSGEEDV